MPNVRVEIPRQFTAHVCHFFPVRVKAYGCGDMSFQMLKFMFERIEELCCSGGSGDH
jgi:hypothetical protein